MVNKHDFMVSLEWAVSFMKSKERHGVDNLEMYLGRKEQLCLWPIVNVLNLVEIEHRTGKSNKLKMLQSMISDAREGYATGIRRLKAKRDEISKVMNYYEYAFVSFEKESGPIPLRILVGGLGNIINYPSDIPNLYRFIEPPSSGGKIEQLVTLESIKARHSLISETKTKKEKIPQLCVLKNECAFKYSQLISEVMGIIENYNWHQKG
ncbi:MAG: hypothetical protein V1660_02430 [archaeon]